MIDFNAARSVVKKDLTAGDVHIDTAMGNGSAKKPGRLARWKKERVGKATQSNSLYVRRNLTKSSAKDFIAWAKSQGFTNITPTKDLHVTIVYSKGAKPSIGDSYDSVQFSNVNGRAVEPLGDKGAVVLRFRAPELEQRWKQAIDAGATWDYPSGYKPHVTITYDGGGIDLSTVIPYQGTLAFGPEIHEPINENWAEEKGYRLTVAKAAPTGKTIWAWSSVIEKDGRPVVDHQGDMISEPELERAFDDFMSNSRLSKVMHDGRETGRVVQGLVFTKELQRALGIDIGKVGALVKIAVTDPEAQRRVASGELRELSIGGSGRRKEIK